MAKLAANDPTEMAIFHTIFALAENKMQQKFCRCPLVPFASLSLHLVSIIEGYRLFARTRFSVFLRFKDVL